MTEVNTILGIDVKQKKFDSKTIFSDLNNVVAFLKKYVIDEVLDEIYRVDTNNKDNNITNLR